MKTSFHLHNQKVQETIIGQTNKKKLFENKLFKVKKQLSFHDQENWNDEHIIKYRNHLKDVRELRSRWQINDRNQNYSVQERVKCEINDLEQSIQNITIDTPKKKLIIRPFSSHQKRLLQQISQIYSFSSCANRQNKMNQFLQSDDNYANRSFRYYQNFNKFINQIK